ncbi:MAG: helix-hairpin-helix domain-containing protein [Cytophagaceae bacterium]|jgi:hypothetical protein|nr:helix-hairpin-helix domain-containing protein [Cytophagaceae bacterium]
MKHFLATILLFVVAHSAQAQTSDNIYEWAAETVESMASEQDDTDYSYLIEDLVRLSQNPLNINTAQREDLEQIFFLNDIQIENLLFHRYVNGRFYSVYEMQAVEGFSRQLIEMIQPLIFFGDVETIARKHTPRADLFVRTRFTAETPEGFRSSNGEQPPYLGYKPYFYSRFEITPLRNVDVGLVTENDSGEPMFGKSINTFDFVSGYVSWKPNRFLKQVIAGQYKISGGQGLALQTGMSVGKSSNATSIRNRTGSFGTTLSANEYSGMNGLLLLLGNEKFTITPFLSIQKRDGRIDEDAGGNTYITGLRSDGYHRTTNELTSRRNTREDVLGAKVRYFLKNITLEAGHVYYRLQHPLRPEPQLYNRYYFSGIENNNSWISAEGGTKGFYVFSEIAFNRTLEPALWLGLLASPANRLNWVVSFRRLPLNFHAPLGAPFAESTQGAGETGVYSGVDIELPLQLSLSAYIDYFKFRWLRYQINAPSDGFDALANLTHKPNRTWETSLRFRRKEKAVNLQTDTPEFPVGIRKQNQIRLQTRFSPTLSWTFTTRVELNRTTIPDRQIPDGFYASQEVRYQHPNNRWYAVLRYGTVDAENYESRFYIYEPDVLYSFNVPMYYGKGNRAIAMLKYTILPKLDVWLRVARWHYFNRDVIGSANNRIDSNRLHEFRVQIRKRF